ARPRHELVKAQHIGGNELVVKCAHPLQFGGEAHASSTSVPGKFATCRSACSAILVRNGSITTSLPPLRFARRTQRTRCRLVTVALLPQTTLSMACSANSGGHPATVP